METIGGIIMQPANPKELRDGDFEQLYRIAQDMWARASGLGEYVICDSGHISSKEEVYPNSLENGKLVFELYVESGSSIINCPSCEGKTRFVYGVEYIEQIRERLVSSVRSILIIARDIQGEIVGFMDAYIDPIDKIYERELCVHYGSVSVDEISQRIHAQLGYIPGLLLSFSAMGLIEKYSKLTYVYLLLNTFFQEAKRQGFNDVPGITELDRGNNLYKIYAAMGSCSLGIGAENINNTHPEYQSDLVVFPSPVDDFNEKYSGSCKSFVRTFLR